MPLFSLETIFAIFYGALLVFYGVFCLMIVYHLIVYSVHRRRAFVIVGLFLAGSALFALINISLFAALPQFTLLQPFMLTPSEF